jgi:hypothetical protein
MSNWNERTFSATGRSTGAAELERLRPPMESRTWRQVDENERKRALVTAKDQAISRVLTSLREIEIPGAGKRLGDALSLPGVGDAVKGWLQNRPVTSVRFAEDLSVRVALSAPPDELWHVLRSAMARREDCPAPKGEAGWDRLREQVLGRMATPVANGIARSGGVATPLQVVKINPANPPDWVGELADAEGHQRSRGSHLQTNKAARAVAVEALRRKLDALPLARGQTVGDAAKRDARIEEAISRSLAHAKIAKVVYEDDGSVRAIVSLRLEDLWAEITR